VECVLRYVKEVLEIIVDVYLSCEESTLKLLVELTENALTIFTLAIADVTTPVFLSLRLLVQLMAEDRHSSSFRCFVTRHIRLID